jgi:hypothetical protein
VRRIRETDTLQAPPKAFQSSPTPGGGCDPIATASRPRTAGFNPHPPQGAGATPTCGRRSPRANWFQSSPTPGGGCDSVLSSMISAWAGFNPHPPQGAGATMRDEYWPRVFSFQSSPTPGGGCDFVLVLLVLLRLRFNPHPPQGAGATRLAPRRPQHVGVSILTHPRGRVRLDRPARYRRLKVVSILTHPRGRVRRHQRCRKSLNLRSVPSLFARHRRAAAPLCSPASGYSRANPTFQPAQPEVRAYHSTSGSRRSNSGCRPMTCR